MTKKGLFYFSIKDITEIAVLVALSVAIDTFVKIPIGSTGGSLNISAIPLMIIAIKHGPFKAFIASGIVFGLITCLIDGYGIVTYPLEYLVAFGSIALMGFVSPYVLKNFNKGVNGKVISIALLIAAAVAWATIRFFAASIDSHFIWEYTWEASFVYNVVYVFPSAALDIVLLSLLLLVIFPLFKIYKTTFYTEVVEVEEEPQTEELKIEDIEEKIE